MFYTVVSWYTNTMISLTLRLPDELHDAIRNEAFLKKTHITKLIIEQLEQKWLTSIAKKTTKAGVRVASVDHGIEGEEPGGAEK